MIRRRKSCSWGCQPLGGGGWRSSGVTTDLQWSVHLEKMATSDYILHGIIPHWSLSPPQVPPPAKLHTHPTNLQMFPNPDLVTLGTSFLNRSNYLPQVVYVSGVKWSIFTSLFFTQCFSSLGNPSQISRVPVAIKVLDVNDNAPELASGDQAYLCENGKSGKVSISNVVDPTVVSKIISSARQWIVHFPRFSYTLALFKW